MSDAPLIFADAHRAEQFRLIGHARGVLHDFASWKDEQGIAWAEAAVNGVAVAATWLGPGASFDADPPNISADERVRRLQEMREADDAKHWRELTALVSRMRLGPLAERACWAIHQAIMSVRSSNLRLADVSLGRALWGVNRSNWPRHWRTDMLAVLNSLTWLHLPGPSGVSQLGAETAAIAHVECLRGQAQDSCGDGCHGEAESHHHLQVTVGRGFLGVLEQFARSEATNGVRTYNFPVDVKVRAQPSLRSVGKSGRLITTFLPSKLGDPAACRSLSTRQHRLLQAIVRETTRSSPKAHESAMGAEVMAGNRVPMAAIKKRGPCPLLDSQTRYVAFNGNRKRKGQGYRLNTPSGWLFRSGYPLTSLREFFDDLAALVTRLGLTVVGFIPGRSTWLNLSQLRLLTNSPRGVRTLGQVHLRVYTEVDYLDRWTTYFREPAGQVDHPSQAPDDGLDVAASLAGRGMRTALAQGLGIDRSFLSKLLRGKKPWPPSLLQRARSWISDAARPQYNDEANAESPACTNSLFPLRSNSFSDAAVYYRQLRWSVVPQLAGAKHPCVKWKPLQDQPPTDEELCHWSRLWPDAGIGVVLGPVSNLFVLDVDGPEAHQALLARLGAEPIAPKVLSGSRAPYRYHLFFSCPSVPTKAKATPWHPKLEFRGKGGIVVLPPSLHKSGNAYAWASGQSLHDLLPPPVPMKILESLSPLTRPTPPRVLSTLSATPHLLTGAAAELPASSGTRRFLEGAFAEGPEWNVRLYTAACDLAARHVPIEAAQDALLAGARPWDRSQADIALRTIASAYSQPRSPSRA